MNFPGTNLNALSSPSKGRLSKELYSPLHTNYAYMRSYIQDPFRRPWKKDLRAWVLLSHLIVIYMK